MNKFDRIMLVIFTIFGVFVSIGIYVKQSESTINSPNLRVSNLGDYDEITYVCNGHTYFYLRHHGDTSLTLVDIR